MKKAFLVEFTVRTRVVVDVPEDYIPGTGGRTDNNVIAAARGNITDDPVNYLYGDNAYVEDDEECPYDEKTDSYQVGDAVKVISNPSITETFHGTDVGKIITVITDCGSDSYQVEFAPGNTGCYKARDLMKVTNN